MFQQAVFGGGRGAHSVAGHDEIPSPGPTSAQPGGASLGHGEGLVSKVRGKVAGEARTCILVPRGGASEPIHSVGEEWE